MVSDNSYGQLGHHVWSQGYVLVPGLTDRFVIDVACGNTFSAVLTGMLRRLICGC